MKNNDNTWERVGDRVEIYSGDVIVRSLRTVARTATAGSADESRNELSGVWTCIDIVLHKIDNNIGIMPRASKLHRDKGDSRQVAVTMEQAEPRR